MLTTPFTIGKGQHPMKPHRMRMVHDLIVNYDMHRKMDMCVCAPSPPLIIPFACWLEIFADTFVLIDHKTCNLAGYDQISHR